MQGTLVDFVATFNGVNRAEAWRWLGETCGFDVTYDPADSVTDILNRILGPKSPPKMKNESNPPIKSWKGMLPLTKVDAGLEYMLQRGLSMGSIEAAGLQWDPLTGRVAIPYLSNKGDLVGFKARDITGAHPAKYLVLGDRDKDPPTYGFKPFNTSLELYGHNEVLNGPRIPGPMTKTHYLTIVVVEGELNRIKVKQAGVQNVVGLPTAAMSMFQAAMLRQYYEEVILYLDCDDAGNRGVITAESMLGNACKVLVVPRHDRDPMDSEHDEIVWNIEKATSTLTAKLTGGM